MAPITLPFSSLVMKFMKVGIITHSMPGKNQDSDSIDSLDPELDHV